MKLAALEVERWGCYSIGVNLLLLSIHGFIAVASGSLAVAAELLHNVADTLTAVALLVGLKLSVRRSDAYPYGLYKVENLIAVAMALAVFFTAYEIARQALLAPSRSLTVDGWMLVGLVLSTAIPLAFSHLELRAGRRCNSPALVADAKEFRIHCLTTGLVFVALASQATGWPLDRLVAVVIVLAIIKTGWDLLLDALRVLLDASLDAKTLDEIRAVIATDPALEDIRWLMGRNTGRFRFVEAGVVLRVRELHRVASVTQRIERQVRERVPYVERVLVHVEAAQRETLRLAVPLDDARGTLSEHFGSAPYFALLALRRASGALEGSETLANPFQREVRKKGLHVANWLVDRGTDVVLSPENLSGAGPWFVFQDAGVEVATLTGSTLDDVLDGWRSRHGGDTRTAAGNSGA